MKLTRRRLLTLLPAAGAVAGGGAYLRASNVRYYEGPVSDHFDGERFFDPHGASPNNLLRLIQWQAGRDRGKWPNRDQSPYSDRPPRRVDGAALRVSFVGHASILLQTGGRNLLLDPVWSFRASPFSFAGPARVNDPGIDFDALPPIDAVLISHCHYDHLDAATLSALATSHRPRVMVPLGNDTIIRGADRSVAVETHDWGETVSLASDIAVTQAPMRHWSARGLTDRNKALWSAFVIDTPAGRIYHVGDAGYGTGHHYREARAKFGPFRLAILPIGAYEPRWFMKEHHMNPAEAVQALLDTGAEYGLAHHFGTFPLADDAYEAPIIAHDAALRAANVTADRFRRLRPGEVWEL